MNTKKLGAALLAFACGLFPLRGIAQSALVHLQGEPGAREAYFADFAVVWDRTPVDRVFGPVAVREMDTVIVYESADKPEFSALRLQFECVVKYAYDGKNIPKQPEFNAPIKVRVAQNSWKLRREDLKAEVLPAGDWRSSASPVLLKLHKVACNEDVMRSAMVMTAKSNRDMSVFKEATRKIGLPDDLQLVAQQSPAEYLEFSWGVLWAGARRPDPSGKWSRRSTKEEQEAHKAQIAAIQEQMGQLTARLKPQLEQNLKQADAQMAAKKLATDIRGGRKMNRNESLMLATWEGKTETEVGAVMGAPVVSQAGKLRFLTYGNEFGNSVVTFYKGAVIESGLHESCNVQFVLHPDEKDLMRVVDVRIWSNSTMGGSAVLACMRLLETPR